MVGLYLDPPAGAAAFSFDEKTQVQALDRTQPSLPMIRGRAGTMTHDYARHRHDQHDHDGDDCGGNAYQTGAATQGEPRIERGGVGTVVDRPWPFWLAVLALRQFLYRRRQRRPLGGQRH